MILVVYEDKLVGLAELRRVGPRDLRGRMLLYVPALPYAELDFLGIEAKHPLSTMPFRLVDKSEAYEGCWLVTISSSMAIGSETIIVDDCTIHFEECKETA